MFAFAAPLGAEVNDNGAAISAALTKGKSNEALVLISHAFSALKPDQAAEAKALIKSILAVTPIDLSGKVVVQGDLLPETTATYDSYRNTQRLSDRSGAHGCPR